jgi:hypothetical protein
MDASEFEKLPPGKMMEHFHELSDCSLIVLSGSFANRLNGLSDAEIRFAIQHLLPKLGAKLAELMPSPTGH